MDEAEAVAQKYLAHRGHKTIRFEPDGNMPPDFLVDESIAVEVRRLNQNDPTKDGPHGLDEVAVPLWMSMRKFVLTLGPPKDDRNWYVSFTYQRPLPEWRVLRPMVRAKLEEFRSHPSDRQTIPVEQNFTLELFRTGKPYSTMLILGGCMDEDAGGWLLAEMERNIKICIEDKKRKIERVRDKYPQWWLLLVDQIGFGLDEFDRELFRDQVCIEHDWNKIILIDPRNHERAFEI